jgi:hypothetical protein
MIYTTQLKLLKCCRKSLCPVRAHLPFETCELQKDHVRFDVFTAVTMKNALFWDVKPCGSCRNRRFGGTYRLHHQDEKNRRARNVSGNQLATIILTKSNIKRIQLLLENVCTVMEFRREPFCTGCTTSPCGGTTGALQCCSVGTGGPCQDLERSPAAYRINRWRCIAPVSTASS